MIPFAGKKEEAEQKDPSEASSSSSDIPPLLTMFEEMSSTSSAANHVVAATAEEKNEAVRTSLVFEKLKMLTRFNQPEEPIRRKKARFEIDQTRGQNDNDPQTPIDFTTRWPSVSKFQSTSEKWNNLPITPLPIQFPYVPNLTTDTTPISTLSFNQFHLPSPVYTVTHTDEVLTEDELMKMKGPSRLIAFLVDIAMNERARKALRWTGNGLEFILINKELVAKMWGNRKHNTKDMDYYKLSRAIREKYAKKDKNKSGQLMKGSRTYSYVFTENAYENLRSLTGKSIEFITKFAFDIGLKYRDNADITVSNSPQAPSPHNSD